MAKPTKKEKKETKYSGTPVPVRLDKQQEDQLKELNSRSGLPKAVIIRTALDLVLPKILSGEINPFAKKCG